MKLLSPKDLTHIRHILNVINRNGPQNPIRIAKEYQILSCKKLVEKKNTLKHFELYVDRNGIKEGKAVKTVVRDKY